MGLVLPPLPLKLLDNDELLSSYYHTNLFRRCATVPMLMVIAIALARQASDADKNKKFSRAYSSACAVVICTH